jgi:hypothetical protein
VDLPVAVSLYSKHLLRDYVCYLALDRINRMIEARVIAATAAAEPPEDVERLSSSQQAKRIDVLRATL